MPEIMGPKFVSNPKQAFASTNKKRLIALILILIALPVTVVLALTQQSFINRASGPDIAKIEVSPGIITADINDGPIHVSALAYNSSNVPVEGNVQYSWSMSSSNTVGTLSKIDGNVVEFSPLNYGCGQLTVSASFNGVVTKSISVAISDGVNVPNCAPPNSAKISKVEVSPGIVSADLNEEEVHVSALAYDATNNPITNSVTYEWSMSSTNSVGTLSQGQGPLVKFSPEKLGCGELTIIARSGEQVVTKAIAVIVRDGFNLPTCASAPTRPPSEDTTPPKILNPRVINITETKATIAWETDEPANGYLDWGLTTSYGKPSGEMSSYRKDWLHNLSGLTPDTIYHFRITSTDEAGNEAVSRDYTFRTLAVGEPTLPPPTVTPIPQVLKVNLKATADSFVRGGRSNKNYGTKTFMATHDGKSMISYMKFDLRTMQGKEIKKATLKFKVLNKWKSRWAPSRNNQNLMLVGNNWTERGLTFSNKPVDGSLITSFKGDSYGKTLTLDVTDAVDQEKGGYISFSVNSEGNDMMAIYSRESNNQKPTLLIEYY